MNDTIRPRLFISHHSSKLDVAMHVETALARHDIDCWIAPRDVEPGEAFDSAIMSAIRDSAGVLLLFCSQSDKSPHVKRELILADSAHKAIIPLRLEDIVPHDLAYQLASAQWIDWLEKRDEAMVRIAAKARSLAGAPPPDSPVKSGDDLHAALLAHSSAPSMSSAGPASIPVRTLVTAGLLVAVAVLAGLLLLRGGDAPRAPDRAPGTVPAATAVAAPTEGTAAAGAAATPPPPTAGPPPPPIAAPVAAPEPAAADAAAPRSRIAPTFDCDRAATRAEILICANDELAALDREMARAYRQLFALAGPRQARLAADQRSWRVGVRDACSDVGCIAAAMRQRIVTLDQRRSERLGTATQ